MRERSFCLTSETESRRSRLGVQSVHGARRGATQRASRMSAPPGFNNSLGILILAECYDATHIYLIKLRMTDT